MKPLAGTSLLGIAMTVLMAVSFGTGQWSQNIYVSIGIAVVLLWMSWVDFVEMRLPDYLTLPLIVTGLTWSGLVSDQLVPGLVGAIAGFGAIWALNIFWQRVRGQDGIGLGDAKLLAGAGAWLGWMGLPLVLLIASGAGLIATGLAMLFARQKAGLTNVIAFGPFLSLGFWAVWCLGSDPALWLS
jgi:leader peptidase (prepilin peptidase)/N-methyltransferase